MSARFSSFLVRSMSSCSDTEWSGDSAIMGAGIVATRHSSSSATKNRTACRKEVHRRDYFAVLTTSAERTYTRSKPSPESIATLAQHTRRERSERPGTCGQAERAKCTAARAVWPTRGLGARLTRRGCTKKRLELPYQVPTELRT